MKKFLCVALALFMTLALTACAQQAAPTAAEPAATEPAEVTEPAETAEATEPAAEESERVYIAAVAAEAGIPYFTTMQWGAMDAAKDYNVELYWTGPAEWDFTKQMPYLDGVLATNPDALMLVPTDSSAMIAYVEKWMADGLPVICTDAVLEEHVDLVGYNSNPYEGGAAAANMFFEMNGPNGVYLPVSTNPGAYGANLRVQGFIETIQKLDPEGTILETVFPKNDANKAAELVSAAITGNPDMTGIFVATSAPASGAASAVIESGNSGKIKIAAFDADPQQVQDLKNGVYDVLIAQNPYQMGYDAIMNLAKYVRGEITDADFPEDGVQRYTTFAITRDNMDSEEARTFKYIATVEQVGY
ncbi:MAG: substrate-binding domain-containing protein [Candidatus Pelethousia sp.]|nr:substrate-binding domain-containing protein [Candidatus Pelethousia sp.]